MDDTDNIENQALHLCEKDSAPPSPKRSKPNRETTNELFVTEGGLENDGVTQSCVLLTLQSDKPGDSYNSGRLSFSQSASQERETHVENALQESVTFSGLNSGCAETDCAAEEGPAQNRKQPNPGPGLFVTVGERARLPPQATHQKPESGNQEGLDETGLPYQCHHQSHAGGILEAGYILHCLKNEAPSANTFAMQNNSLEYIPVPYMPSYEAECGINSLETFAEMEKNQVKNEDNKARLETDAEEDANIWNTETQTPANVSFAGDVVQYADDSSLNGVMSDGNSENNDRESRADPEPGFPGGNPELAERERPCFRAAAARTASACAEHTTGDGLAGSRASREPPDVIDAAAVIESRVCPGGADGTGEGRTERAASGRRSPATAPSPSDAAADEGTRRSDGRAPCPPREADAGGCREGDAETARETACEEWLGKDRDKIPEASVRLVPSSEVIPVIIRIHKLDAPPSAEASEHVDGEFTRSLQGDAAPEPTDPGKEFTCETGTGGGQVDFNVNIHADPQPAEQQCGAREEQERLENETLRHEEHHCANALCASTTENCCERSQTQVSKPDAAHRRCEVRNLASHAPSNGYHHIRTVDTVSPTGENTVVNAQAEERHNSAVVVRLPVGSAKAESEVEERENAVAAGRGDGVTENDILEGERGPPSSPPPQTILTHRRVTENISAKHHHSDATHLAAAPVKPPGDAVVPETDAGYGADALRVRLETQARFPVRCLSDCSPVGFDSFEKIPLLPGGDELEHGLLLLDCSSRNPVRGRPQSYYDVDGPSSETIPMQIRHQPCSGLNETNTQLAESEWDVDRGPSQKGSVPDCGSHFDFGQGGSHEESQSTYLCGIRGENQIPDVCFSQCPQAVDPEQSVQLAAAFGAREQFCLLPEFIPDASDEQGRLETCPQPTYLRPQTSVLTPASSQNNGAPLFEMKEKFDLVLEELSLFSSIGKEAKRPGGPETPRAGGGPPEDETAKRNIGRLTSPAAKAEGRTGVEQDVHSHIRAVGRQPETTSSNVGFDCEQEVPLGLSHSSAEGEDSMYSAVKQKERIVSEDGPKQWLPAFMVLPFLNEQNRARRLEPLKTCVRPIRVGLSKRERPKQLHPYFK